MNGVQFVKGKVTYVCGREAADREPLSADKFFSILKRKRLR